MLEKVIIVMHVLTAISIVALILLQQGKGADMGASFGSGSSSTVFGAQGSGNILSKSTAVLSALFFLTSLGLAIYANRQADLAGEVGIPVPAAIENRVEAQVSDQSTGGGDIPEIETSAEQADGSADDVPIIE